MHIGISRPQSPPHPIPDVDAAVVARHAEQLGFESVFYGEHPIRPVAQAGHAVHRDGVPFFQDTLVALSRISAATTTIRFGGGVFLVPEHNPVQFAKELASLDHYGRGRLLVGCGVGWSRVECELLGGHWDRRWAQTEESIKIMRRLWTQDTVTYDGEFYRVPPVQLFPKPAAVPHPPILIGAGASERTFTRIADYADGWLPAFVTREAAAGAAAVVAAGRRRLDQLAVEAGRDPAALQITAIARGLSRAGAPELRARIAGLADAGADRVLISMPTVTSAQEAADALDRLAEAAF
ncbi:TIGR03619 family F420-dependent LLM class oxidoreductase [Cryptosporangium aurantiacum]|uniref:Probable F420-dependent oxidoreductase, Rv2161c family n=1 Tax=Cryptosporangium aurantiacum TaxID=134849 RepID=A0A1M7R4G7_9ACTN|nr:TIGR03619 family F420-dependent LLM class oxidoreductase [Cryptosporangium aurantiacum]SHN40187.1 probable F420-dependent oxidoreductase, Rv2161c family [Cryptosporangium aurantiacum]